MNEKEMELTEFTTTEEMEFEDVPRTKPERTTRGRMREWANGTKVYTPEVKRGSARKVLGKTRTSSFFETAKGFGAQLFVKGDSEDRAAALMGELERATRDFRKEPLPTTLRGESLMDLKELKVSLERDEHQVVALVRLDCSALIMRQLQQVNEIMYQTLSRHMNKIKEAAR